MKIGFFHLMPYRFLPDTFENDHRSVWVDPPRSLYDAHKTHGLYNEFLDELEHAERCGFDGLCVNEHHQNAYGLMPSPNLMAATLTRRTSSAAIIVLGNSLALYNPPVRVAEEFAMLDVMQNAEVFEQIQRLAAMGKFVWPIPDKGLKKRLHRVAAPTLILWGDHDRVNPGVYGEEFARRIRGATLQRLPGGHMLHLESPAAVAAAATQFFG